MAGLCPQEQHRRLLCAFLSLLAESQNMLQVGFQEPGRLQREGWPSHSTVGPTAGGTWKFSLYIEGRKRNICILKNVKHFPWPQNEELCVLHLHTRQPSRNPRCLCWLMGESDCLYQSLRKMSPGLPLQCSHAGPARSSNSQ